MRSSSLLPALALGLAVLAGGAGSARADGAGTQQAPQHKMTQLQSYVEVEPMYATIIDDGRPIGLLLVAVGLNTPDTALRAEVATALPVLRDAYLRNMMLFAATAVRSWKQPDVSEVAARLQRITDRMMHKKGSQVLLTNVAIRITR
ncbi:MAG: hypothetical protein KGR48_16415 [Alphaproteobacteria bacterium]|nr:hypothetical protein [Alphaproteobacteria bacterium]MBU6472858.1 hypothetical protein [Alphaproteobacteria bacterium]MDE2011983.1 hypothetical protein [Alphaproteobacteria bacterium]MDE2074091.1 hypothetical protein [Alphaproteobacteria bacterium]MDE2350361.1 hypothetical protein [Alphaproteobacteria bacterium]